LATTSCNASMPLGSLILKPIIQHFQCRVFRWFL
jgi:hypothetical protein